MVGAGASGAIFGLAGALIAALYLGKLPFPRQAFQHTLRSLLAFAGYNLLFGVFGPIDNSAHIGGLVMGLALGAIIGQVLTGPPEVRRRVEFVVFLGAGLVLLAAEVYLRHKNG